MKTNQPTLFRDNGAIGAMLDEYEKALNELVVVIEGISNIQLIEIVDPNTEDEDCRSVQSILTHVVQSGYSYVVEIRKWLGEEIDYKEKVFLSETKAYKEALMDMFRFNEKLFADYPDLTIHEYDSAKKVKVRWGQRYDVEQMYEHAIVHILKHRRQIERFKLSQNEWE